MDDLHPSLNPQAWSAAVIDRSVLVADGSQVKVTVRNGHLHIADGVPGATRERTLPRVPRSVTRLVILARRGYITLEALRWCSGANLHVTHIAEDITMTSGSQSGDAEIIVLQTRKHPEIARHLIDGKIWQQAMVLELQLKRIVEAAQLRDLCATIKAQVRHPLPFLRSMEAVAARVYWEAWRETVAVPWSPPDLLVVPEHWRRFPGRQTLLHEWDSNRGATDPLNAMLNYVYKVLESEAIKACQINGLHPDLGFLHTSRPDRNALALDLMEPVRPYCDQLLLRWFRDFGEVNFRYLGEVYHVGHYFDRRWCHEERNGKVVLDPPLTHAIAGWAGDIGGQVRAVASDVKGMISNG